MDAIDILGGLLGRKTSGAGRGGEILKEIFKRGSRPAREQAPPPQAAPSRDEIQRQARELEELLGVAHDRVTGRDSVQRETRQPPTPPRAPRDHSATRSQHRDAPPPQDERAALLVRAMVNAAKADGQLSSSEQQSIFDSIGNTSPATIQFLREEFSKPLDVREFAWSVPIGMEQQVYTMSLIAIDLDTRDEANYLRELAHGLRIHEADRQEIHKRLGV